MQKNESEGTVGRREITRTRNDAAAQANAEDADVWRWFSSLVEEGRLRWCRANGVWLVTVDHRHRGTDESFDAAIRQAKGSSIQ